MSGPLITHKMYAATKEVRKNCQQNRKVGKQPHKTCVGKYEKGCKQAEKLAKPAVAFRLLMLLEPPRGFT